MTTLDLAGEEARDIARGTLDDMWLVASRRERSNEEPRDSVTYRVSVVLPALNEAESIGSVLQGIPSFIDEVIVVDGNSTDATVDVVRRTCPWALVLQQSGKGKGNALKTGLNAATGDIIVTMDADGSMTLDDVAPMIDLLVGGCDFVKGSRALPGAGSADFTPMRYLGNWALTRFAQVLFGPGYTDITYGFNAYWREVVCHLERLPDGFEFEIEAAIRAARGGLQIAEVPCYEDARIGGASKLSPARDGLRILKVIAREAHPRRRVEFRRVADLYLAPIAS